MSYYRFLFASVLISVGYISSAFCTKAHSFDLIHAPSDGSITHIHTSTPITEPAPLFITLPETSNTYKTVGVCFFNSGDCGGRGYYDRDAYGEDLTVSNVVRCAWEGYEKTSCVVPEYLTKPCTYDSHYFAGCVRDEARACREMGYEFPYCGPGEIADSSCPYGEFVKCKCDPCYGYDYTYPQATAQGYLVGADCLSCSETKYKRKENPCQGFQVCECGGDVGAYVCYSGSVKKYSTCKACCENKCTLSTCPDGHDCSYEACSGKYCDNGCETGYSDMCQLKSTNGCVQMGFKLQLCMGQSVSCPYNLSYVLCL